METSEPQPRIGRGPQDARGRKDAGTDVVEKDKDLLRGGSGEQGQSRHPATDEDLLNEGSGWSEPTEDRSIRGP